MYGSNNHVYISMPPISTGYQGNQGESALPPLHSKQNVKESFLPTRSSPQITNFGIVGASVALLLIGRYLHIKFYKKKDSEIKQESSLILKEINKKLTSIFDENIIFNEQESTIKFNNFSLKLCQKMKNFFIKN